MIKNFAVFILSYGRPKNIKTLNTLNRFGYTGKTYIVCSDDDNTLKEYIKIYKDQIKVFNKDKIKKTFDIGDNFTQNRVVIFARNAVFDIAKNLNIKYFLVLDDDYTDFSYRFDDKLRYKDGRAYINNVNDIFKAVLEFYKKIPAKSVALSQNGDWIGGKENSKASILKLKRKCMNSFFCSTDRQFKFIGRINEDVTTYVNCGSKGDLFFTINNVSLKQTDTQQNKGGLTEFYLDTGTYVKSFYSVLFNPSCVKVSMLNTERSRLHHKIKWNNAVPKIINEKYKI
tara:strand:- start:2631 stop:3485 length:855 start_codon:yes stop_codon:yes gene_type:complete